MKSCVSLSVRSLLACLAFIASSHAEMRQFTDVDGRTLQAEIVSVEESTVKVKLRSGKTADIDLARLSEADRSFVGTWRENQEKAVQEMTDKEAQRKKAEEIPIQLVAFCKDNLGKQVGNGECWTLADQAFRACGIKRPTNDLRVWGRKIDFEKEKLQEGDIVEYRTAKFSNGTWTGPEHTSVIVKASRKTIVVAQQNWGGKKTVSEMEFDPSTLVSGELTFYRPVDPPPAVEK
jgi:uncharacterized protein (DUF2147 family)